MSARFIVGDVHDVLRGIPDGSVDLILTSPPFLALRSYLPADHPLKAKEIGSEPTPGAYIDTLLALTEEWDRVLAPHGSICVELGDTYSGSGGAGGDYSDEGLRAEQPRFDGSAKRTRASGARTEDESRLGVDARNRARRGGNAKLSRDDAWPEAKSLCLIPELYRVSLVYGFNPLTGRQTPRWRARNVVRWCLDGDSVVYARTPKGEGPARLLHLSQNWQPGQWELWDGERWAQVLGWSSTEADDAIEIGFRNGERISATREHEWPTQRGLVRTQDLTVGDVVQQVRLPEPVRAEPGLLPDAEIGWLVGTFLADGSFDSRDRIQISGHRDESALRMAHLERLAEAYDGHATAHDIGHGNEAVTILRSPILAAIIRRYVGGAGARNKCLRAAAWRRSNAFLDAVLRGYLDGDGHYDAKNDRWRVGFTDNGWLARDLRVMCARLGYSCRVRRLPRAADPRGGQFAGTATFYHRGDIRFTPGPLVRPDGEVMSLKASKRRRFYDIGVEGEPHLFALGSGLLTHNCRPNPPVGALGDKFRPATSDMVVACKSKSRYFDLDAVRSGLSERAERELSEGRVTSGKTAKHDDVAVLSSGLGAGVQNPAGAPPLDWWNIPTEPFRGAHYATWPTDLLVKPILAMCPSKVCRECGKPSERIVGAAKYVQDGRVVHHPNPIFRGDKNYPLRPGTSGAAAGRDQGSNTGTTRANDTLGWTDCGHNNWRSGIVLDPFAGSGTTLVVATGHGRDAVGIDLDARNADLARERCGMFLEVEYPEIVA